VILTGDYHTHTPYSHGKNTVAENVARAKEIGLKEIAISDHGFTHVAFGLRRRDMPHYIAECQEAQKQYGIRVLVGIEANICGLGGKSDLTEKDYEMFDVYNCGNHVFIFFSTFKDLIKYGLGNYFNNTFLKNPTKNQIQRNTTAYINVIKNNPIDTLTHLNYICPSNALEVAKCAADYGTYIELNSKKTHLSDEELFAVAKTGVKFVISSDAHSPNRVGEISLVDKLLQRVNIPEGQIANVNGKLPTRRFKTFKENG
jgi:putative hydrolase